MNLNTPLLVLAFVLLALLAVSFYELERIRIRAALKHAGLGEGKTVVQLPSNTLIEVEVAGSKWRRGWLFVARLRSLQERRFRIALPVSDTRRWDRLDRSLRDFCRQAYELGFDEIRQEGKSLEAITRRFLPIQKRPATFSQDLGTCMVNLDWSLSSNEGKMAAKSFSGWRMHVPRGWLTIGAAALFFILEALTDLVYPNAILLEKDALARIALIAFAVAFSARFAYLRRSYRGLQRRLPVFFPAFRLALVIGALLFPSVRYLNFRLDSEAPIAQPVRILEGPQAQAGWSPFHDVQLQGPSSAWTVQVDDTTYRAAQADPGSLAMRLHPGAFHFAWAEVLVPR